MKGLPLQLRQRPLRIINRPRRQLRHRFALLPTCRFTMNLSTASRTPSQTLKNILPKPFIRLRHTSIHEERKFQIRQLKLEFLSSHAHSPGVQGNLNLSAFRGGGVEGVVFDGEAEEAEVWLVAAVYEGEGAGDYALHTGAWGSQIVICALVRCYVDRGWWDLGNTHL